MTYQTIARDATSNGIANPGSSLTHAHTCTGSNLVLIVGINTNTATDTITGVTYNGVAMTRVNAQKIGSASGYNYLYSLLAPATGSNNIVISCSTSTLIQYEGVSYTGVKQSGQPTANAVNSASGSTSCTNVLTTPDDNSIHVVKFGGDSATPSSVTNGTIIGGGNMAESNPLLITPAGSHTMTGNASSQNWATCGASFAPAEVIATGGAFFQFM